MRTPRMAALVAGVAAAVLAVMGVQWLSVTRHDIGRSDFTSTYVGATLLRAGEGDRLYDETLQTPLHDRLIAPDHEGNLPFVAPPTAAVLALPLSALDLATAYRLFSALQVALLIAAVAVAARAAPWPGRLGGPGRIAVGLGALAGTGTLSLLLLGQWDGLVALGLALCYADLRGGQPGRAGLWLALGVGVAKPHLGLGLAAFVVARRQPRLAVGAAAGIGAVAAVSLLAVGAHAVAGFIGIALGSAGRWPLAGMLGFTGLFASWLGDTGTAHGLAAAASLAAIAGCALLGDAVRRAPERLEAGLGGAAALSLVASPHLLGHDLAVLAPAAVWSIAAAGRRQLGGDIPIPGRARAGLLLGLWAALAVAARLDIDGSLAAPPGRLVPWVLAGAGLAALTACGRSPWPRTAALRRSREPVGAGRGTGPTPASHRRVDPSAPPSLAGGDPALRRR